MPHLIRLSDHDRLKIVLSLRSKFSHTLLRWLRLQLIYRLYGSQAINIDQVKCGNGSIIEPIYDAYISIWTWHPTRDAATHSEGCTDLQSGQGTWTGVHDHYFCSFARSLLKRLETLTNGSTKPCKSTEGPEEWSTWAVFPLILRLWDKHKQAPTIRRLRTPSIARFINVFLGY